MTNTSPAQESWRERCEKAEAELAKFPDHRCPSCGYPEEPGADFPGWVGMKRERDLSRRELEGAKEAITLVHRPPCGQHILYQRSASEFDPCPLCALTTPPPQENPK